jgi:hypothetical protein
LQLFYGGDPRCWLEIPTWLFWAFVRMMPVLQARESIQRINEGVYASGNMKEEAGRDFIRDLERLAARAQEGTIPEARRPGSLVEMTRLLGAKQKVQTP